jgi:hypothetical protein
MYERKDTRERISVTVIGTISVPVKLVCSHLLMIFTLAVAQFLCDDSYRTTITEEPCTVLPAAGDFNNHTLVIDHCTEL